MRTIVRLKHDPDAMAGMRLSGHVDKHGVLGQNKLGHGQKLFQASRRKRESNYALRSARWAKP
jgi:hypothetical protein